MATVRPIDLARPAGPSWPRLLLLVLLGWWTLRMGTGLATWCFLDLVNLAFHEAGHLFFAPFGSTMHYLGGTLGQLLVPTSLAVYFVGRQRQPFGGAFCCWWLGESLINVSIYMSDARSLALPLVGGGDHDWNELLFRFGFLSEPSVQHISGATHVLGVLFMLAGWVWSLYFVLPVERRLDVRQRLTRRWPALTPLLDD